MRMIYILKSIVNHGFEFIEEINHILNLSIVYLVDKAKVEIATGSSLSFVSQTAITTSCATTTTDEDFIWSSSLSDDNVSESSTVHLVDKAKAEDIATGSSLSSGSQTAITTSCATPTTDEDFIWSSSLSDDYVSES